MGRPKSPNKVLALHGETRKERFRENALSGSLVTDTAICRQVEGYSEMNDRAKRIFRTAAKWSISMGALQFQDLHLLAAYAIEYDIYLQAVHAINTEGVCVQKKDESGAVIGMVANPAVAVRNTALRNLSTLGGKFGYTPNDRLRIGNAAESPKPDRIKALRMEIEYDEEDVDEQS